MLLLRGATYSNIGNADAPEVSIHAPLARSNACRIYNRAISASVSIHAPLARSNAGNSRKSHYFRVSIHAPLARSNDPFFGSYEECFSFNTCSSCEEQLNGSWAGNPYGVSIHAPLARSNHKRTTAACCVLWFQYMLLLRGATPRSQSR